MIAKDGLVSFKIRPSLFLDKVTPDTILIDTSFQGRVALSLGAKTDGV
jgi:hypothetical protein